MPRCYRRDQVLPTRAHQLTLRLCCTLPSVNAGPAICRADLPQSDSSASFWRGIVHRPSFVRLLQDQSSMATGTISEHRHITMRFRIAPAPATRTPVATEQMFSTYGQALGSFNSASNFAAVLRCSSTEFQSTWGWQRLALHRVQVSP